VPATIVETERSGKAASIVSASSGAIDVAHVHIPFRLAVD
jgi:hypothetical protein